MAERRDSQAAGAAPENASGDAELARLRREIDAVDRELLAALNARASLVKQVGALKARGGVAPVYVASRERDLIATLTDANPGPFPKVGIGPVFREIISATRSLEEVVRVAFLGPLGTFSHQAAVRQFGAQVDVIVAQSIREVFELTERGKAHYGVVPVENSIEGVVTESFDALVDTEIEICGELLLQVSQALLSAAPSADRIQRIASHPQGLAQCRNWLQRRFPGVEVQETPSTAGAAEIAAGDPTVAAIASEVAAEVYGLGVLERSIEDRKGNTTRFLVIGRETPSPSGADLSSAVFTVRKDQSGALYRLLEPFARHSVNLTAVQSRPMKGKPWEYLFFVDMEGHAGDPQVAAAIDEAATVAYSHKVLGSYPAADERRRATQLNTGTGGGAS